MNRFAFTTLLAMFPPVFGQALWINEFHYVDDGSACECGPLDFLEIAVPASMSIDNIAFLQYDSTGAIIGGNDLNDFFEGWTEGGITFYAVEDFDVPGFALDDNVAGLLLVDGPNVIQFLSYGGTIVGQEGPADGLTSTDIGLTESTSTTPFSSLGLVGTGNDYTHFSWAVIEDGSTFADYNLGQTITPVPEPYEYGIFTGLALLGFGAYRRRSARKRLAPAS